MARAQPRAFIVFLKTLGWMSCEGISYECGDTERVTCIETRCRLTSTVSVRLFPGPHFFVSFLFRPGVTLLYNADQFGTVFRATK